MQKFDRIYKKIINEEISDRNIISEKIEYIIELEENGLKQYLTYNGKTGGINCYKLTTNFNYGTKISNLEDIITRLEEIKNNNAIIFKGLQSKGDIVHFLPETLENAKILKVITTIKVEEM